MRRCPFYKFVEKFIFLLIICRIKEVTMEKSEIVKQIIDANKTFFENYFSMMVMFQDQTEDIWEKFIGQAPGMDEENKKIMEQWISLYKQSRENFKKAVDNGYAKAEAFFDYNAILEFQEQNEKIFNSFLSQADWMPQDFRKAAEEVASTYKKSRDEFKKYVDENINRVNDFVSPANKPKTKSKRKK